MTETMIVFITGMLLSFPAIYWIFDKFTPKRGAPVRGPRLPAITSEASAFQQILIGESLDRVLRLVDDLQRDLSLAPSRPGPGAPDGRVTALTEDRKRSLAECKDLVSALLADDDARQIRTALARLEKTSTLEEFLKSLGHARTAVVDLRQDLVEAA